MTAPLAITGATGALGRRVLHRLADRGVAQRAVVRDPTRVPDVDGVEVVVAGFGDEAALTRAFTGTRTLFLVSAGEHPDRRQLHEVPVRAAAAAGVERVVYTSFLGAAPHATFPYARDHAHTERAIRDAGLALTALRNTLYADIVPHLVADDGVLRGPAGRGRIAWVAREDIARLAVEVLLDDTHADRTYDVTGPEPLDLHETARQLATVTGRPIRYEDETLERARATRTGNPEWLVDGWIGSYLAIATGESGVTSHTIEAITGRRPWTIEEFLHGEPASWHHLRR